MSNFCRGGWTRTTRLRACERDAGQYTIRVSASGFPGVNTEGAEIVAGTSFACICGQKQGRLARPRMNFLGFRV